MSDIPNTYLANYEGEQEFIDAFTKYDAVKLAAQKLKVPPSKRGLLAVVLVQLGDKPISETVFPDPSYY